MEGHLLEDVMFTSLHPTLLAVHIATKLKLCFITKENTQYVQPIFLIFLDESTKSPKITCILLFLFPSVLALHEYITDVGVISL
jgi:hypothetical protein